MFEPGSFDRAREVKAAQLEKLLATKNVVGVGIGAKLRRGQPTGDFAIRLYVSQKLSEDQVGKDNLIPPVLDNIPTDVVEIGMPIPFFTTRNRPAIGGDSIGHFQVTAGTLGCLMRDRTDGQRVILSNNHVLANADSTTTNRAIAGDCIVQPGTFDGGICALDQIATLKRWVELIPQGSGTNTVDCAIATPLVAGDVQNTIHEIGCVSQWRRVTEADVVANPADPDNGQKSGRTTDYTTGRITDIDGTFIIPYASGNAVQTDCIVTDNMASPGDSGSLLVDMNRKALGLLFGGSVGVSVFYNKIENVLNALNLEFLPCTSICLYGPVILCRPGGPLTCVVGGPITCVVGGPRRHCIRGPDIICRPGGPTNICPAGGPMIFCNIGGPDSPRCPGGGGPLVICSTGPDQCLSGPEIGCLAGPPLIEGVINPDDLVKGELIIDLERISPEVREKVAKLFKKLRK
jgi:hypothetical protein